MAIENIGVPVKLEQWWVTGIFRCRCKPDGVQLVLHSGHSTICPHCLWMYTLNGVNPNGTLNVTWSKPGPPEGSNVITN